MRNELRFFLYFLNFFKIAHKVFRGTFSTNPFFCFLNNFLDYTELNYFLNILVVVGPLEHGVFTVVFQFQKVQQLQPKILELVRIIFEQFKVVTNRTQNLIEFCLELSVILCYKDLLRLLYRFFCCHLASLSCTVRWSLHLLLVTNNKTILFCILLQFVFYSANNIIYLRLKLVEKPL